MNNKIYLITAEELTRNAKMGEKIFLEYRDREEEFEYAQRFENYDWEFTLGLYSKLVPNQPVKFFKKIT